MSSRRHPIPPEITSEWNRAPRTSAWDDLWRLILSEILDNQGTVNDCSATGETPNHEEGFDGPVIDA